MPVGSVRPVGRQTRAALAGGLLAALAVTGCGGGGGPPETISRPDSPPATSTPPPDHREARRPEPSRHRRHRPQGASPRQLAGRLIVYGIPGTAPPERLLERIRAGAAASVIVFSRNVASAGQVRDLIRRLQNQRPRGSPPLLVMTDQEGGDVRRIPGPPSKPAAALGAERGGAVERAGRETGCNLARAGVNVDLAPVADVARTGSAIAAEGRAFGTSPGIVSRRAVRFAAGLRRAGVAATAKHFPGFGAAPANTDTASVTIDRTRSELEADLAPFRALIERRIPLVMLSTAIYPALSARPAALSPEVAGTLLRHELGFHGVTVTDDLEGAAVSSYGSPAGLAARAVRAGADLAMFAQSLDTGVAAARGLAREIATDRSLRRRSRAAGLRVTRLRERLTHDSCR